MGRLFLQFQLCFPALTIRLLMFEVIITYMMAYPQCRDSD